MGRPTLHPSSQRVLADVHDRFRRLRTERDRAADAMWSALLAANFTDAELTMLSHCLSPHDHALLRRLGRPQPLTEARGEGAE